MGTKVPKSAVVTQNAVNMYEQDRQRNAETKEDTLLTRFCNGKDNAWRPDSFFTEACGDEEVPPWPVRPQEIFTNPQMCMRVMAHQMEQRKKRKEEKKAKKAQETLENPDKKSGK